MRSSLAPGSVCVSIDGATQEHEDPDGRCPLEDREEQPVGCPWLSAQRRHKRERAIPNAEDRADHAHGPKVIASVGRPEDVDGKDEDAGRVHNSNAGFLVVADQAHDRSLAPRSHPARLAAWESVARDPR